MTSFSPLTLHRNASLFALAVSMSCSALLRAAAATDSAPSKELETEVTLALSACPAVLRDQTGVFVLDRNGYRRVRETHNGFNALVQHSMPGAQEPQCMDAEASRTVMVRYLKIAEWRAAGKTPAEIKSLNAEAFASGVFPPVAKVGVDYMLSPNNEVSNFLGVVTHFPPHVMFIGTRLKNADLGVGKDLGPDGNPVGPAFVAAEGSPYAMIIVPSAEGAHVHPAD
jgi:hypothetical protein